MSNSNKHLYRCLDTMKADANISEETKIVMFVEYARLVTDESKSNDWVKYDWNNLDSRPPLYGRYEVYRSGCEKQHYEVWNGLGWASNNKDITHWRVIKNPYIK